MIMPIRIGLDVDGVLADFFDPYERLTIELTGRNLFPPRQPFEPPPTWDWPEQHGYTAREMQAVWAYIVGHGQFWMQAEWFPRAEMLVDFCYEITQGNMYFITDRPGHEAKIHTERWLRSGLCWKCPVVVGSVTVLQVQRSKGLLVEPLGLTHFVEDKREHAIAVAAFGAKSYLLDRPYNQGPPETHQPASGITRVKDISELMEVLGEDFRRWGHTR